MGPRWVRLHAAAAGAVLVGGVVTALVGGGSSSGVPQAGGRVLALIERAPGALHAYPSVRMTLSFSVDANGRHFSATENALISRDGRRGTMQMALPDNLGELRAVTAGHTMYAHVAPGKVSLAQGHHWVSVTLTGTQTQPVTGENALGYLRLLTGADGGVQAIGRDAINGVQCTHYRVDVDVAKAAAQAPPEMGDGGQTLLAAGVHTLPMDIWLDGDGAPRQLTTSYSLAGASFKMTMQFTGSDARVHVAVPAASDVLRVGTVQEISPYIVNAPGP